MTILTETQNAKIGNLIRILGETPLFSISPERYLYSAIQRNLGSIDDDLMNEINSALKRMTDSGEIAWYVLQSPLTHEAETSYEENKIILQDKGYKLLPVIRDDKIPKSNLEKIEQIIRTYGRSPSYSVIQEKSIYDFVNSHFHTGEKELKTATDSIVKKMVNSGELAKYVKEEPTTSEAKKEHEWNNLNEVVYRYIKLM